jgi:hypothetical protein
MFGLTYNSVVVHSCSYIVLPTDNPIYFLKFQIFSNNFRIYNIMCLIFFFFFFFQGGCWKLFSRVEEAEFVASRFNL